VNSVRVSGLASQPAEHAPCSLCFINRDARLASLFATPRPQSVTQCVARSLVSPSCFLAFFARSRYGVHGDILSPMAGAAAAASATRTLALLACWCGDDREVVDEKERCQDRALEHIGKVESRNHASGKITNGRKKRGAKSRTAKTGAPNCTVTCTCKITHQAGKNWAKQGSNLATPVSGHSALTNPSANDCCTGNTRSPI